MAPYNAWPVLLGGLAALYALTAHSKSPAWALLTGWLFGFGYFVFGLSWIGNALLVEGNPYRWAWPLAVAALPAVLAFFPALACAAARKFYDLRHWHGFLAFTALLALSEFLRGHLFTGFPWNLYGHTWAGTLPVLQILALGNVYWLTILTVFWAFSLSFVALNRNRPAILITATALVAFAGCWAFGLWRLALYTPAFHEGITVKIVQPSIAQADKWKRDKLAENFETHIRLSRPEGGEAETVYIVWPETALTHWLYQDPAVRREIEDMLAAYPGDAYLLTGFLRYDPERQTYGNSLLMIGEEGAILNSYDKSHLVPFGEYIPFQRWIPLEPIVKFSGFQPGSGPQTQDTPENLRYSPLVCYEIIFSGKVTAPAARPDFIVNVTNDAWYGDSAGPHQHFAQAVFRAVEEGIPVIRAANNGYSGIIGPVGNIMQKTKLDQTTTLIAKLPKNTKVVPENAYSGKVAFLLLICALTLSGLRRPP